MSEQRSGISRRFFLGGVVAAVAGVTATTAGQTVPALDRLNVLGPRTPGRGTGLQALPVNRSAAAAEVADVAMSPDYRLRVTGAVDRPLELTVAELEELATDTVELPMTCVEGWSVQAQWTGIGLRDLLVSAGAREGSEVRVESIEQGGLYRASHLTGGHAWSRSTVLATGVNGERLDLDHGYPVRLVAPSRPGVLQTKWLQEVVVL